MSGILYGVGVGPGDPELMTIKAVNTIRKCEAIAFPGTATKDSVAFNIAIKAVPEMEDKVLIPLEMPMSSDKAVMNRAHNKAIEQLEELLRAEKDVAFLVLGDVTIYSTFMYLKQEIAEHGFQTELVSGITSFCASAAGAGISLCQWDEKLVIVPSKHQIPDRFVDGENYVLMKAGKRLAEIRDKAREANREVIFVQNCGMDNEKIVVGLENMPDEAGYYSIVIVR